MEEEIVYGEDLMRLAYGTHVGLRLSGKAFLQRWLSRLGGLYFDSGWSRRKIRPFVERLGIDLSETSKALHEYRSFNEFFARNLKQGRRPIDPDLESLISPADGRLLVFPRLEEDTLAHVKWAPVHLMELFNRERSLVKRYSNGACGVLRLGPPDYHRFHFPVAGTVGITTTVPGFLHSVSPYALEKRIPVFALTNEPSAKSAPRISGKFSSWRSELSGSARSVRPIRLTPWSSEDRRRATSNLAVAASSSF